MTKNNENNRSDDGASEPVPNAFVCKWCEQDELVHGDRMHEFEPEDWIDRILRLAFNATELGWKDDEDTVRAELTALKARADRMPDPSKSDRKIAIETVQAWSRNDDPNNIDVDAAYAMSDLPYVLAHARAEERVWCARICEDAAKEPLRDAGEIAALCMAGRLIREHKP